MSGSAVIVDRLEKTLGKNKVLRGISLEARNGEIFGLLGTLETLLLTPAPRSRVLLGKIAGVTTVGLIAAVAAIGSMFVAMCQISIPSEGGQSAHITLNPAALPVMVWLALLIAISMSAVTLAIGTLAKSFRQGQHGRRPFTCSRVRDC